MQKRVQVHRHLGVLLSSAFIYSLLSDQAIDDLSIIQFPQSLVLQPLSLLAFCLQPIHQRLALPREKCMLQDDFILVGSKSV